MTRPGRFIPLRSVELQNQTAAGDHAMQVRMMEQHLSPGMEHGKEAEFGAEVLGSAIVRNVSAAARTRMPQTTALF